MTTPLTMYAFPTAPGLTDRTLPDRLAEIINVKDWGATGLGVADDWNAIMTAFNWNASYVVTTQPVYSGALRIASFSQAGSTVTVVTTKPHGWGTPSATALIKIANVDNTGAQAGLNGNWTATVVNTTSATFTLASGILPLGYFGYILPQITAVTWSANVVTIDYGAPHQFPIGTPLSMVVAGLSAGTGTRTCTATTTTQLTFPLTGSGTITGAAGATIVPPTVVTVASVPSGIILDGNSFLGGYFPDCEAQSYFHVVSAKTSNTVTFGTAPFQADIPSGSTLRVGRGPRGVIFFPKGTYRITQAIPIWDPNIQFVVQGVGAASIIRGNFADWLMRNNILKVALGGPQVVQKMHFINDHASGNGVEIEIVGGSVIDCIFEINGTALSTTGMDYIGAVSFSVVVKGNIFLSNGSPANAVGIDLACNNAACFSNYFKGLNNGIRSNLLGQTIRGSKFIDCAEAGIQTGGTPVNTTGTNANLGIYGVRTENCGIGIWTTAFSPGRLEGVSIVGGAAASYGLRMPSGSVITSCIEGVDITGLFSNYGVSYDFAGGPSAGDQNSSNQTFTNIRSVNSGGLGNWRLPTIPQSFQVADCNVAQVNTFAQLTGYRMTSLSYNAGTGLVTVVTPVAHGFSSGLRAEISGVTVGGSLLNNYNGQHLVTVVTTTSFTFSTASDPGTADANTGGVTLFKAIAGYSINGISWAAGVVTLSVFGSADFQFYSGMSIEVTFMTPAGWNGIFVALSASGSTLTYALAVDPGSHGIFSGTPRVYVASNFTESALQRLRNVWETQSYNISDGQKAGTGTANVGDLIQGGGSQRIMATWTANGFIRGG